MARYTDEQYYARFFNPAWSANIDYATGTVVVDGDIFYEAAVDITADASNARPGNDLRTDANPTGRWRLSTVPQDLGENRFITLEDTVNNYMVLYADEDSHGGMPMRRKVEAFGQRAIQEFSYDTFTVKEEEYEVLDSARYPFPLDLVELVGVFWLDEQGNQRPLQYRKRSSAPINPLQIGENITDSEGNIVNTRGEFMYEDDGSRSEGSTSTSVTRWNDTEQQRRREFFFDTTGTAGQFNYGNYYTYGNRYYIDPEIANRNGTYTINQADGILELDPGFVGEIIVVKYISDGLSNNLSEVKYHKFAEQSVYDYIYYHMIMNKSRVPANEKQRAQRASYASRRTAKLRLSNLSPNEMIQVLRRQSNWIKT